MMSAQRKAAPAQMLFPLSAELNREPWPLTPERRISAPSSVPALELLGRETALLMLSLLKDRLLKPGSGLTAGLPRNESSGFEHQIDFLECFNRLESGLPVWMAPLLWTDYLGNGLQTLCLMPRGGEKVVKLGDFKALKQFFSANLEGETVKLFSGRPRAELRELFDRWESGWLASPRDKTVVYQPYALEKGEKVKIDYQDAWFRLEDGLPVCFQARIWARKTDCGRSGFARPGSLTAKQPVYCLLDLGNCRPEEATPAFRVKGFQVSSLLELEAYARLEFFPPEPDKTVSFSERRRAVKR